MSDFAEWLDLQLKEREWRPADLARRSGVDSGLISNILNRKRNAGPETCRDIARALNLPEELVFRKAGLLSPKPEEPEDPPTFWEWIMFYLRASKEERDQMLEMAEELAKENEEEESRK